MISRILYYLLIKPLSLLPLPILYYLSDFLFIVIFRVLTYRKKVVVNNLRNSFPEKNQEEINELAHKFYRHLCDLVVESIKTFSISTREAIERCRLLNPEVIQKLYDEKRSIIVVCGHYNNWELAAVAFNSQIPHQTMGIYTPLSNKFFNGKIIESRGRNGINLVPKNEVKKAFEENSNILTATVFGSDQSPSAVSKNVYWVHFLNQDTAVLFGSEKYAVAYNYPVVFMRINKVKRGYYEFTFEIIEESPSSAEQGSITEKHTRLLEQQIIQKPEFWLWTHKRWKRKRNDF